MQIEVLLAQLTRLGTSWVLWALVGLSVIIGAIILERIVCYWSSRDDVHKLAQEIGELLNARDVRLVHKRLAESPSFEARVAAAALRPGLEGAPSAEKADQLMLGETERVRLDLEKYLGVLGTVGSNAPFVGLLGTVLGIVGAFQELDTSHGTLTDGLMADVGEALVATAIGLFVALPAIAAFNAFRRVVQIRLSQSDVLRRRVLAELSGDGAAPLQGRGA